MNRTGRRRIGGGARPVIVAPVLTLSGLGCSVIIVTEPSGVQIRRIYDPADDGDGRRVLVDRLWPRGISKDRAQLDQWCKEIAPSTELRKWYAHDPDRYAEFARRYRAELTEPERAALLGELKATAAQSMLTLLTATKHPEISEAAVLSAMITDG